MSGYKVKNIPVTVIALLYARKSIACQRVARQAGIAIVRYQRDNTRKKA